MTTRTVTFTIQNPPDQDPSIFQGSILFRNDRLIIEFPFPRFESDCPQEVGPRVQPLENIWKTPTFKRRSLSIVAAFRTPSGSSFEGKYRIYPEWNDFQGIGNRYFFRKGYNGELIRIRSFEGKFGEISKYVDGPLSPGKCAWDILVSWRVDL